VSRSELPKKKLNEYNEYLKNGGMSNLSIIQPISSEISNKSTTTAAVAAAVVTATAAMEEEEEEQQEQEQQVQEKEKR